MAKPLAQLAKRGQSVWIDNLSRELVHDGGLQRLIDEDSVTGVTSNPTIFQKAIAAGDAYDEQLKTLVEETDDPREIFFALAVDDVCDACDVLRKTWDDAEGRDGYVSLEVEPGLAYDTEGTFEQAMQLHERVDRPNLYVKIPATQPGLPAIEDCIAHGKSINITLIFSLARYRAVAEAYIRGLEALGNAKLQGRLGIANARLAYKHFTEAFSGPRWEFLEAKGASKQKPLWASTSTKNPAYRDVMYVEDLIGPDTVNTMPPETVEAFQDHGRVTGDTVLEGWNKAEKLLGKLADAGVDYDDVVDVLEAEGVQKFADSFDQLLDGIRSKRGALATA